MTNEMDAQPMHVYADTAVIATALSSYGNESIARLWAQYLGTFGRYVSLGLPSWPKCLVSNSIPQV